MPDNRLLDRRPSRRTVGDRKQWTEVQLDLKAIPTLFEPAPAHKRELSARSAVNSLRFLVETSSTVRGRFAIVLVLTTTLLLAPVLPAFAHSGLALSSPTANAQLTTGPAQVELWFTDAVEPAFSTIDVLDTTGTRFDNSDTYLDPIDPTHLVVSVRLLPPGVYTVVWKVLSTVDSHVTSGAFSFVVGNVSAAEVAAAGQADRPVAVSLGEVIGRWLTYLASAMLAGGSLFVLVIWQPAYRLTMPDLQPSDHSQVSLSLLWRRLAEGALVMLVLGSLLTLLTKAGQASGTELAAPWSSATANLLFNTRYGLLWMLRFILSLVLVGLLVNIGTKQQRRVAVAVAALLLLSISLGSHAASEGRPVLPVLGDWAHMAAASVWVGGLTHFAAGIWVAKRLRPDERKGLIALLISRFTILAVASVGLLGMTGLYLAWLRVGNLENLWGTVYGRVLLVKSAIVLPMLLLGAGNLLIVSPRHRRPAGQPEDSQGLTRWFNRSVNTEAVLGVMLLLSVGLLTSIPPAQAAATPIGISLTGSTNDLQLALNIAPGRVGVNTFTLEVRSNGQPVMDATEVALRFAPAQAGLPPSEALLVEAGDGRYALQGAYLRFPDNWQVQAVVRRADKSDSFSNFDLALPAGTSLGTLPWHLFVGLMLTVAGVVALFAARGISRALQIPRLYRRGVGVAGSLVIASVFVFYYPDQAGGLPVNPILPDAASIATGAALYQTNCVPCHGVTGKGNGPVGLTLNPRPADLTVHTAPGAHPDGRLYEWISNGFPGNAVMPAFRKFLTDDERWHLVNYIRTLSSTP